MPAQPRRVSLVVNPASGRGRAGRLLPRVRDELCAGIPGVVLDVHESTSYFDARDYMESVVAEGHDQLLVMGGDGMAHLGLNACAESETALGVIPAGTGNDFVRGVDMPRTVHAATQVAILGSSRAIDLSLVTGAGVSRGREWVGSIVSTGYDARVNFRTNQANLRFGPLAYAGVALGELATYRPLHYRLEIDGVTRELDSMFVAVANAGWFGGGMNVCPQADLDDGLLDIAIVHPMKRATLLKLMPSIYFGRHVGHPAIEMVRARSIRVDGDDMFAMADGELLGDVPLQVTCVPSALRVLA